MRTVRTYLGSLGLREAWTLVLTLGFASVGAVGGLVRGLDVHPPTAGFAMFEVGAPAALVGAVLGSLIGTLAVATRNRRHRLEQH